MINKGIILAGGKGTRMRELTESLPKPMVRIGERPVIDHLIEIFDTFPIKLISPNSLIE